MSAFSSQEQRILAHLSSGHTLTALEALDLFGTIRLPARICALRKRGHKILSKMIDVERRDGTRARIAQYSLAAQAAA